MYRIKLDVLPSYIIILMGTIDAITTVIGTMYFGATELNPLMTGIVNTNIVGFLTLKLLASFCIGATYVLVKRILNNTADKTSKSFKYGNNLVKIAYTGLIVFLIIVVTNNLIVLLT
jgi:Domain of unknown function (DUF5658)